MVHYRNHRADARQAKERMEEVGESKVISMNREFNCDSNGVKIMKNGFKSLNETVSISYNSVNIQRDNSCDSENGNQYNKINKHIL